MGLVLTEFQYQAPPCERGFTVSCAQFSGPVPHVVGAPKAHAVH